MRSLRFAASFLLAATFANASENRLKEAVSDRNEEDAIAALARLKGIPDSVKPDLLAWATSPEGAVQVRRQLLRRFEKSIPARVDEDHPLEQSLHDTLLILLKSEFRHLKGKTHPTPSEFESISLCLRIVARGKIKALFYSAIGFIAFPLTDVRRQAYQTIAALEDDRMYPIVLGLASSPKAVERTYALDALYYINDSRTVPLLLKALKDKNKSVRYYAIRTLEKLKRTEAIPYFIRIVRADLDDEVRVKAIQVLADFKPRSAFSTLTKTVSDKNPAVRREVLKALLRYKNRNACYPISSQLHREDQRDLKLMEIKALLTLGDAGGMKGLKTLMKYEADAEIRLWAVYTTGALKDFRGFKSLIANLTYKEESIRVEAAFALARFKDKKAVPELLKVVGGLQEKYTVQSAAVYALRRINYDRSLPRLFDLSESHPNPHLRNQLKAVVREMIHSRY